MGSQHSSVQEDAQSPLDVASPFEFDDETPRGAGTIWTERQGKRRKRTQRRTERTPLLKRMGTSLTLYGGSFSPANNGIHAEKDGKSGNLSWYGATFTILNVFLGLGVLSLPYAFEKGKVWSGIFLVSVALIAYITGDMLIDVAKGVKRYSYPKVALELFGKRGMAFASLFVSLEFLGAAIMTTIFLWNNLFYLVKANYLFLAVISSLCCTPTVWLLNFDEMSILNVIGVASNVGFVVTTVVLAFFKRDTVAIPMEFPQPIEFSMGFGIFVLCFAGHACLTGVIRDMKEPEHFSSAMKVAFVCMVVIYCGVGFAGIIMYGEETNPLLTKNMKVWPGGIISQIVTILIVLRSFVSIAPLLGVAAEIQEELVFKLETDSSKRSFRTALFWIFVVVSYLCSDNIDYVEAITGSLASIVTVFVLPPIFYLKHYPNLSSCTKLWIWVLIIVAIILGTALTVVDVYDLIHPNAPATLTSEINLMKVDF